MGWGEVEPAFHTNQPADVPAWIRMCSSRASCACPSDSSKRAAPVCRGQRTIHENVQVRVLLSAVAHPHRLAHALKLLGGV